MDASEIEKTALYASIKFIFFALSLLIIYVWFFYLQSNFQMRMDFYSFYASAVSFKNHLNPFQELVTTFATVHNKLPPNLNPPLFIILFSPLSHFNVTTASSLWFLFSLILGSWGSIICLYFVSPKDHFRRLRIPFVLMYLATYASLLNAAEGQLGHLLLFFTMLGYYFFYKQKDFLAGAVWGLIISIKLFPALLFFFVVVQKRYKAFFSMFFCSLLLTVFSLQFQGLTLYSLYVDVLSKITWFGINWNGSLYGYIYRLLVNSANHQQAVLASTIYYSCFILLLIWYVRTLHFLKRRQTTHQAFCLTLIMMLLLSPLGWIYYFTLLTMPLTFVWFSIRATKPARGYNLLWGCCLFLINLPTQYKLEHQMEYIWYKMSIYSIYFYGLLITLYLLLKCTQEVNPGYEGGVIKEDSLLVVQCVLGLCLFLITVNLLKSFLV